LAGSDFLFSNSGNDVIYGDEGNDTVLAKYGNDTIYGGPDGDGSALATSFGYSKPKLVARARGMSPFSTKG
jgi:Ca2+-binding RTX toxin-like protein